MAGMTPEEVDGLIRTHITQQGNASARTMLIVWRLMVDGIIERLEGLQDATLQIALGKRVAQAWSMVVVPAAGSRGTNHLFPVAEISALRDVYLALNEVALETALLFHRLPCNTEGSPSETQEWLYDVGAFVREGLDLLKQAEAERSPVYIAGWGFKEIALRCMTLLSFVLGSGATAQFKEQYEMGIDVLNEYARMAVIDKSHLS